MLKRLALGLLSMRPCYLICAIIALEGALVLALIPRTSTADATYYSIGFVDDYDKLGAMLSQGYGLRFTPETGPTLTREPGYPLLLAGIFTIFGRGLTAVRIVNLVFAGLSAGILSKLVSNISTSRIAPVLASLLFLVHPGVVVAVLRGGVEIPFILLMLCFIFVLCRALESKAIKAYVFAGLLLGVACLVRSTALLFPLFLPIYFMFGETPRPSLLTMAGRLAVIFGAVFVVLSPWMVRNFKLVGSAIPTASVSGLAAQTGLYICKNVSLKEGFKVVDLRASAIRAGLAHQQGYSFVQDYYLYFYNPRDEVRFSDWLEKQVMDEYRQNPALFAKCVVSDAFYFWFAGKNWTSTFLNALIQVPYLVAAILGGLIYRRAHGGRPIGLFVLFCSYTMLVYLPIHAQARYSVPLVPLLALLAAVGAGELWLKRSGGAQIAEDSGS